MRVFRYIGLAVGVVLGSAGALDAQKPDCSTSIDLTSSLMSDARRALWRSLSVTSHPAESGLFRSSSLRQVVCVDSAQFLAGWGRAPLDGSVRALPVEGAAITNSAYPRSINDGAQWAGVGINAGITAGARARWRFLDIQIAPEFYYQQNSDFAFVHNGATGFSEFSDPYHEWIDYPTRFGSSSFTTFNLGQSYVSANYKSFGITAGTENIWIGAADVYPILMSYTAPGFPHIAIGTKRPVRLPGVNLEFQLVFGSLNESEHFDTDPNNNDHYFGTTMLVVEPTFLKGFYLSVARALHDSASIGGQSLGFYTKRIITTPFGGLAGGNVGSQNGIGLIAARWVLPDSKFEAYAEWAREDTPGGWLDVLREPDWTQAYVLGFQKVYVGRERLMRVYGELNHLGEAAPVRGGRGFFSYYTHTVVLQGHTNDGQLLGAAIGPGSDAQLLGADLFSAKSRTGFRIERTRYDDDTYYHTFARRWGETRHDAEITLSATHTQMFRGFEVGGGIAWSRRYGRQFLPLSSEGPDLVENNISVRANIAWTPTW